MHAKGNSEFHTKNITRLTTLLDEAIQSRPDDIRALGWAVAVHNDYRLNGVPHTFWLFTKGNLSVRGEGRTDRAALDQVRAEIRRLATYQLVEVTHA